jgi:hypothetical protein
MAPGADFSAGGGGGGGAPKVLLTSKTRQGSARGLVAISIDKVSIFQAHHQLLAVQVMATFRQQNAPGARSLL